MGSRNGNYRHGYYTSQAIAERASLRNWMREVRTFANTTKD